MSRGGEQAALIAQLGERQTEDLKVLCSIHSQSTNTFTHHSVQLNTPSTPTKFIPFPHFVVKAH